MVDIINILSGKILRYCSFLILQVLPVLKSQFDIVKARVNADSGGKFNACLMQCVTVIEDHRFFQHGGVDMYSIARAIIKNMATRRIEGASTIGQQLVRSITGEHATTLRRKIKEIMFSVLLEREFSKEEILNAYFATYRFDKCVGLFEFCRLENYNIANLTAKDAVEIAARFKYPYLKESNYIKYLKRVRTAERRINSVEKFDSDTEVQVSSIKLKFLTDSYSL